MTETRSQQSDDAQRFGEDAGPDAVNDANDDAVDNAIDLELDDNNEELGDVTMV